MNTQETRVKEAMAALTRVADAFAPFAEGVAFDPLYIEDGFCELVCDLADPLPDDEDFCTYALVRHGDLFGETGFYVSFRKVARVWNPANKSMTYGVTEACSDFLLRSAGDIIAPGLTTMLGEYSPENKTVAFGLLHALGELFRRGE